MYLMTSRRVSSASQRARDDPLARVETVENLHTQRRREVLTKALDRNQAQKPHVSCARLHYGWHWTLFFGMYNVQDTFFCPVALDKKKCPGQRKNIKWCGWVGGVQTSVGVNKMSRTMIFQRRRCAFAWLCVCVCVLVCLFVSFGVRCAIIVYCDLELMCFRISLSLGLGFVH